MHYITFGVFFYFSDTMGNLGAFITMNGEQLKPNFTTYEAKVHNQYYLMFFFFGVACLVLSSVSSVFHLLERSCNILIFNFNTLVLLKLTTLVKTPPKLRGTTLKKIIKLVDICYRKRRDLMIRRSFLTYFNLHSRTLTWNRWRTRTRSSTYYASDRKLLNAPDNPTGL